MRNVDSLQAECLWVLIAMMGEKKPCTRGKDLTCRLWSELVAVCRTHGQEPIAEVQVETLLRCHAAYDLWKETTWTLKRVFVYSCGFGCMCVHYLHSQERRKHKVLRLKTEGKSSWNVLNTLFNIKAIEFFNSLHELCVIKLPWNSTPDSHERREKQRYTRITRLPPPLPCTPNISPKTTHKRAISLF